MQCYERFDITLHYILTLYGPVAEAIENDLAEAEVAPEEEAAASQDADEVDGLKANAQDSVDESISIDEGEPTPEEELSEFDDML